MSTLKEFERLVEIMKQLRKECPWDKKQTPQSLRQHILEEAYETVESIDHENWEELKTELGDLMLQIVFQAEIAQEENRFTLAEVIRKIIEKVEKIEKIQEKLKESEKKRFEENKKTNEKTRYIG